MSRTDPMMRIRLPQDLKDWVEAEAGRQRRSKNAQIVYSLELEKLRAEAGLPGEPAAGNASQA